MTPSTWKRVKEIFADQPERPKPVVDQSPSKPVPVHSAAAASAPATPRVPAAQESASAQPALAPSGFEQAAAGLIETGVRVLESLAAVAQSAPAGGSHGPIERGLSSLISRDPRTNAPVLSIPLPPSLDQDRIMRAIATVMGAFSRPA